MPEELTDRVRLILQRSGLSQAQFAEAVGLDGPKLTKSLNGKRRFSSYELASIAELGQETVDWLLAGGERSHVFAHRAAAETIGLGDEIGRVKIELIDDRVDGLEFLGRPFHAPELPVAVQAQRRITQGAKTAPKYSELLRASLRSMSTPALIDRIESEFGIHVVVADLPEHCDGLSYARDGLRVIVLATSSSSPFRQRYTLAHELGHIAFQDALSDVIEERLYESKSLEETRANAFAAHFLAPREELLEVIGDQAPSSVFDELVLEFKVSPNSMAFRLFNEELIDEDTHRRLSTSTARQVALRAGRAAEYVEQVDNSSQERPPLRLVAAYLDAYAAGETTLGPIATLLGWPLSKVEATYGDAGEGDEPNLTSDDLL